jgi:hypothetical protein
VMILIGLLFSEVLETDLLLRDFAVSAVHWAGFLLDREMHQGESTSQSGFCMWFGGSFIYKFPTSSCLIFYSQEFF